MGQELKGGKIINCGFKEIKEQPVAQLFFEFPDGQKFKFEGFINKKGSSERNKKTLSNLETVGVDIDDPNLVLKMNEGDVSIFEEKTFDCKTEVNEGGYENIEWIEDPLNPKIVKMNNDSLLQKLGLGKVKNDKLPF